MAFDLLQPDTPLVFADGTQIYKELGGKYIQHKFGLFILAPSGAGKTHFIKNQKEPHWIDGDDLWNSARAHPDGPWWTQGKDVIDEIDQRSDVITVEAKKLGFWIMGASNNWLKPDAIVIPHWRSHKKFIKHREETHYDGGATSDGLDQVLSHRKQILQWSKKGVPVFKSVPEAVDYLANKQNNF